jgi:hypothetical protein
VKGDDDPDWQRWVRNGLGYYARVSTACANALAEVEAKIAAVEGEAGK